MLDHMRREVFNCQMWEWANKHYCSKKQARVKGDLSRLGDSMIGGPFKVVPSGFTQQSGCEKEIP